jgi:hydroxymethylbilane synthase
MAGPLTRSVVAVGTRGSRLALIQAQLVIEGLRAEAAEIDFRPKVISTSGDRSANVVRGDGVFVKEIQRAVLEGEVDLAVHSLKDLPTEPVDGLTLAAIPARADARDCLVGGRLADLPAGARVGTGSPRRVAQLRRLRPDLEVLPIRGNVPTRVEKARSGEIDAVMLAVAGLLRLDVEPDEIFDFYDVLPAPGQGALAVEARSDDAEMAELVRGLDDPDTHVSVVAERAVLREMGGGCLLPVGAFGRVEGGTLFLAARVVSSDGVREASADGEGSPARAEGVAKEVAARLIEAKALDLL